MKTGSVVPKGGLKHNGKAGGPAPKNKPVYKLDPPKKDKDIIQWLKDRFT